MLTATLTDAEVDEICAGLKQNAAKCRFLREVLAVPVRRKPNGRPLVLRADIGRADKPSNSANPGGRPQGSSTTEPNWQRTSSR